MEKIIRFGNPESFEIKLRPLYPTWKDHALSGPWAKFQLNVKGMCLTKVLDKNTKQDGINIPLLPIANWFIKNLKYVYFEERPFPYQGRRSNDYWPHILLDSWQQSSIPQSWESEDWEDARSDWYERHFWRADACGSFIPDLGFGFQEGRLVISWKPYEIEGPRALKFLQIANEAEVDWHESIKAIEEFLNYVAEQARALNFKKPDWIYTASPLIDALQCDAASFAHLYGLDSNLFGKLGVSESLDPESSIVLQGLRDLPNWGWNDTYFQKLKDLEKLAFVSGRPHELLSARKELKPSASQERLDTFEQGYRAATRVRELCQLQSEPILDLTKFMNDRFSINCLHDQGGHQGIPTTFSGFVEDGTPVVLCLDDNQEKKWSTRMALAGGLGHLLLDPMTKFHLLGATSAKGSTGLRIQRARAFAAEFLMPRYGVARFFKGKDPTSLFPEFMETFQVGARTAAHHLYNLNIIHDQEDRDALLESYSAA